MEQATILLVEDDTGLRDVLQEHLSALGYRVVTVASAEAALEVLEGTAPDLILTDVHMGAMSGVELCRRLILATGDERFLESHRREITVVFCDLRGFTAFAETAEPEEVMRILQQYHGAVGPLISSFEGTLEHFAGDGLTMFFNDPLPCPDPAGRAVRMAAAMRRRMQELRKSWREQGYVLDFGVGIALGYATLGQIGFEGRTHYGAIGSVPNLASRLCGEAQGGQILISQRVYAAVGELVEAEPVGDLTLKGFLKPVKAYNVIGLKESRSP